MSLSGLKTELTTLYAMVLPLRKSKKSALAGHLSSVQNPKGKIPSIMSWVKRGLAGTCFVS